MYWNDQDFYKKVERLPFSKPHAQKSPANLQDSFSIINSKILQYTSPPVAINHIAETAEDAAFVFALHHGITQHTRR